MLVEWKESARDRLADIYVAMPAAERDEFVRTVEQINGRLAIEAAFLGESRTNPHRRVWFAHPLLVGFDLVTGPPRVVVTHVARLRPWTANE